jgi:2-polyprenyl-3-methyl-5-hydroxy-6-metoxy-1,4-benzoquinol methylase/uncharacterized protein YbaR (Trm112 family)
MNQELLSILVCPACGGGLEFSKLADAALPDARAKAGIFKCACGEVYPLVDHVPRLFDDGMASASAMVKQYEPQISEILGRRASEVLRLDRPVEEKEYANIRESFSKEWSIFDYNKDKTWGWSLAERKEVFLADMQMQAKELEGKSLLDAGCGNGTLSAALTDFGLNVVALDLNDGLGLAHANRGKYGSAAERRVQYVQGNLVHPPFRPGAFDLVYSSGVIHHTPSSKHSFASLSRMVKPGGRLYVWVYRKRSIPVRLFFAGGRGLKRFISFQALMRVCSALAPAYKVGAAVSNRLRLAPFRSRTTREITLDLFDAFAPRYNHWHTEDELRSWFNEQGFRNARVSGRQKHGFGMYGDKA